MDRTSKTDLRRALRAWRDELEPAARQRAIADAVTRLERSAIWARSRRVALYMALPGEPDLSPLWATPSERTVALPVVVGRGTPLVWRAWRPGERLIRSRFGVPEPPNTAPEIDPASVDLVIVPALAVTPTGIRLGYGGGYYDRTLPQLCAAAHVWLGLPEQIVEHLPSHPYDVPVHALLTHHGWTKTAAAPPDLGIPC